MEEIPKVILMVELSREHGRALLRGIVRYARTYGPWRFYIETPPRFYIGHPVNLYVDEPYVKRLSRAALKNWSPDGIITRDTTESKSFTANGIPTVVAIDFPKTDLPCLVLNHRAIGTMAAEYFLDRGFQHFAYCGYNETWSIKRGLAFAERVSKAGYNTSFFQDPMSSYKKRTWVSEQVSIVSWLKSLVTPVALMACNDDRARDVVEACLAAQLNIPEEIAIIGVDNDRLLCDLTNPPLSSIALDAEGGGYKAAKMLHKMMKGEHLETKKVTVDPKYVRTRQSTDILAINDPDVATAVRFISSNSKRPIQVSDVVDATCLSRRALQKRFKKILRKSIRDEIKRTRIKEIENILLDTDMNISMIACLLGFSGPSALTRFFQSATNISPLDYRKRFEQR